MNIIEKEMVNTLVELRERYGVFEIKAEFEAEGSTMEEMMRLKDVASAAGLPILLKIGGVEAVTDIYCALQLGVSGIVAPMAETAFALSKYISMVQKIIPPDNASDIQFAFNLETITGYQNLSSMLALPCMNVLHGVTVGRVDLTGSMGLDRTAVNSSRIFEITREVLVAARQKHLHTAVGGAISKESLDFIERLHQEGLLDKFETRKVVFRGDSYRYGDHALQKAILFELNWLKAKQRFHSRIKQEDVGRIKMLEDRLAMG